jgi:hypothetical protein
MTFSRLHITVFLGLAVIVWCLVLLIQGTPVGISYLAPFSIVVGFLAIMGYALEHVLWRQVWLRNWFIKCPDLRGTWRVEIKPDFIDPVTGIQAPVIVCYMGVAQTLSKLQMHLMTLESESWFIAQRIQPSPSGSGYQVVGVYTNKPHIHLRGGQSEIHRGVLVLDTHGSPARPESLTGEYWTDRTTAGQIKLAERVSKVVTRFEDATHLFVSETIMRPQ